MATRDTVSYQFIGYETFGGSTVGSAIKPATNDAHEGNKQ
jgi:sarcosine oxidase subunit delta